MVLEDRRPVEEILAEAARDLDALRLDEAIVGYQAAAALAPDNYDAHLGLARTHMRMRDREEALAAADRARALDESRHDAYLIQGVVHFLADELDEAERALEIARERAPDDPEPLLTLAQVYCDRNDFERADAALEEARGQIEAIPDRGARDELTALVWHVETYRHLAAGNESAAREAAQHVLALEEANPYAACLAYSNLGILEMRSKNLERAVEYLERACETNPHFYRAASALGRVLLVNGQPARAADVLERVLAHEDADTADARYAYALALSRTGRRDEAREQYGAALQRGLSGPSLIMARWQHIWLNDTLRFGIIGLLLLAVMLWVLLGEPSTQAITLLVMVVVLFLLQGVVGRRR
jgi:tetratricopeptide (TPR) repeat protein